MAPSWTNPFKRHDRQEFLGVVIPLSEAPRFQHLNTVASTDSSEVPGGEDNKDDKNLNRIGSGENGAASNPEYSHQTLEAIRAEVETEISTSGHDTTYDRRFFFSCQVAIFFFSFPFSIWMCRDMPCESN